MKNKKKLLKNPMKAIRKEIKQSSPKTKIGLAAAVVLLAIVIGAAIITALPIFGIRVTGVVAYGDIKVSVTSIDWGLVPVNTTVQRQFVVTNSGNVPLTLSLTTSQWVPQIASDYITMTNDVEGQILPVGASKTVTLSLFVLPTAEGVIVDFSNTINIKGN